MTEKQKIFVDEYLIDLNATRAYRVAYPSVKKDETAAAAAARLLKNVKVQDYVNKRMRDRVRRTEITQDMVVRELAAIAFSKASDYARVIEKQAAVTAPDGTRIPLKDGSGNPVMIKDVELALTDRLTEDQQRALAGIKQGKYGIEVASCDKVRALELLGRHLGMFKDRVEVSGMQEEMSKLDDLLKQVGG